VGLLTPEILSWIGRSTPPVEVAISKRDIIKYALATGQTRPAYLAGDEAPPMFVFGLFRPLTPTGALGPDGLAPATNLPELPLKRIMAGGTRLEIQRPIRAGDTLLGTHTLADITEKSGRQGPLIFMVSVLSITMKGGTTKGGTTKGGTTKGGELVMKEIQTRIAR